ncbi:MAG: invasion associated locus B family protein [gamma proteobacterium symbiont of Bathyaustriella thionipta]|nr:invasion associated locus B family protein [gamma proteobacterium symbiont of Bathyaustriella thionipta]MCU7950215.1 invasion associated locus B family protein [gamma proteobacterium symbiont of Bathyaustriella thionipta]MCU7952088.1 invasion associated locus B family protein [gamma proteobacterium symbiont of Bathyaustriella thionipta]MCU7956758.1 invasion associated locus B family protein [gamma proteobacterium symbiont of Bathyaustriella thionipta]MCU7965979.1 invasion associated locus B 
MSSISILRSVLFFFTIVSFTLVSNVQAKPEQGKKFKDWTVVCEKLPKTQTEVCNIFQNVTNDKDTVVMLIAIGYPPGKTEAQALITLPLGVLLQPGIEFTGGTAESFRIPFGVCVKNGCVAVAQLNEKTISGMKAGTKGSIKFAAAQKKIIEIPVSLSGFTAAFNSLKK